MIVALLTCDRIAMTRRTIESLFEHNDTSTWRLVYSDDHSVNPDVRPYVESRGFEPVILNDGERLGPTRISYRMFRALRDAGHGPESLLLYIQNDFECQRAIPLPAAAALLSDRHIGWVQLGYAQRFIQRIADVPETIVDGERFRVKAFRYSDRAHLTHLETDIRHFHGCRREAEIIRTVRRNGLKIAYIQPILMHHIGYKKTTPHKRRGQPAPLRKAHESWKQGRREPSPDPRRLHGYAGLSLMTNEEREVLCEDLPQVGRILEVGTFHGATASWLASRRPKCQFVCLDPFRQSRQKRRHWERRITLRNWNRNKRKNMALIFGTVDDLRVLCMALFDRIIVDGEHTEGACWHDLVAAKELLVPNGRIIAHDYEESTKSGVKAAVGRFCQEHGAAVTKVAGRLAWIQLGR